MKSVALSAGALVKSANARRVRRVGSAIVLDTGMTHYRYDIPVERIPDERAVLAWTAHLAEKSWATPALLRNFIIEACKVIGVRPYGL